MRSDFYSLPWAAQQAIRRGERNAHAASARLHTIEELQAAIVAQSDTITRLQAALEEIRDGHLVGSPLSKDAWETMARSQRQTARDVLSSVENGQ